jgi:hypothetical protein
LKENELKRAKRMSMEEETEYRRAKITKVDKAFTFIVKWNNKV